MTICQDALLYAGLFGGTEAAKYDLGKTETLHACGARKDRGQLLEVGDALQTDGGSIELKNGEGAEVLLFDLP